MLIKNKFSHLHYFSSIASDVSLKCSFKAAIGEDLKNSFFKTSLKTDTFFSL